MILVTRSAVALFFTVLLVKSEIYLHNTNDGLNIEYYDCILLQSLFYCRRPKEPINLTRDNDTMACHYNGGELHSFSELRSKNISVSTVLHLWKSSLERIEQYSDYLRGVREIDGYFCKCLHPSSFGKNCEYRLPIGHTFEETLQWQLIMRQKNPQKVQMHGDVVCYETLKCDSGVLCLDWREICDGIQHCMSGLDETNCDVLEMNRCDDGEYRCMNGMCIPNQFFLDGDLDCLDWSDEISFKKSKECPMESVSTECDDHLCPPNEWSCGDGECIPDRLAFQKSPSDPTCQSGRNQYFICETHRTYIQWTASNGRCFNGDARHVGSPVESLSEEEQCEYLLKCALSQDRDIGCSCYHGSECTEEFDQVCPSMIRYPRGAIIAPFLIFLFDHIRDWRNKLPDSVLINGTVRCRDSLITVTKMISFDPELTARQMIEDHFCYPSQNISLSENVLPNQQCHHQNESTNRCNEWNPCLSITRINDGWKNCLNGSDEVLQTDMGIEKSCARVQHQRFRCSPEQTLCISVMRLGNQVEDCRNRFDELWFGTGRLLSSMNCNNRRQDDCSLLREYIDQSWVSMNKSEMSSEYRIRFRSYCDSFWNLDSRDDENLFECHRSWVCPEDQWQCQTGQCINKEWVDDREWDCADASDENNRLKFITLWTLRQASRHNFTNRSHFVPSTCPQSHPFLCLSSKATQRGYSCFNLSQIGDGHIDCAGAMDERNTLRHCSQSSMLGHHFRCPSSNDCIPYYVHCYNNNRCPNRSDDAHWCWRQRQSSYCSFLKDFTCFNGQCVEGGRCNGYLECLFGEDEYMCDFSSSSGLALDTYREMKKINSTTTQHTLRLSRYPTDVRIVEMGPDSISTVQPTTTIIYNTSSSLSPYWCNRGLGILLKNNSIVCFCPPHYYGEKCQYHADRLSVLLDLDLSQSIYSSESDPMIVLKLLVLFLFNNQTLMIDQFNIRPFLEISVFNKKKMVTHFLYPHFSSLRQKRRKRFFNRSDILSFHPYSIRIELYQTRIGEQPSMIAVWKYPIYFDHLPVFRFAKVLRFTQSLHHHHYRNPCSSQPCHPNEECHQLMNKRSEYICLCPTNFTGENCSIKDSQCTNGYCALGSLCKPNSRVSLRADSLPICLCPTSRFGDRCLIELDACPSNPCLNNGSCLPALQHNQIICICTEEYNGAQCQWKRPSIHLSLSINLTYTGAVAQYFQIDPISLDLILIDQQVFRTLPQLIESHQQNQKTIFAIILVKLYSSYEDLSPDIYLLSVYFNVISIVGRTEISPTNRCSHLRTFFNDSSPIGYHQICIHEPTRLCFRDDVYLCICAENHTRVECFLYDDRLDHCSHCLGDGRCLKGDPRRSNDFLCLCPSCHSGRQCQFNTKSFSFTLDQLFSPDLLSDHRQITISLLIFFPFLAFFLAIPHNLLSFVTISRPSCLRYGIGHYLLWMSVINQLSLALLTARLIHLTIIMTMFQSSPLVDDLLCKLLTYLLTCVTRLSSWLPSFVALERVYTTVFFNKQWFKQPHIARSLMILTFGLILLSAAYELVFIKSFTSIEDENSVMCVMEYPSTHRSMWVSIHQIVSVSHFLLPLLINLCSTLIIMSIVIRNKMNIRLTKNSNANEVRGRATVFRDVLNENREMITQPAITLVPSIFSLFSFPFFIISFSLGCQNLENNPLRYLLITFYFITFIPQIVMFYLYIYPSSFYWKQWQSTTISQRITALRQRQWLKNNTSLSTINEQNTGNVSSVPNKD